MGSNVKKSVLYLRFFVFLSLLFLFLDFSLHILYRGSDWTHLLWFCNISTVILFLGVFLKKPLLNTSVLLASFAFQIPILIDFIISFFNMGGLGYFTPNFFEVPLWILIPPVITHFLLIPLSFCAVCLWGFKRKSLLFTIFVVFFIMVLTFLFSSHVTNINCVFESCTGIYSFSTNSYIYLVQTFLFRVFQLIISFYLLKFLIKKISKKVKFV